MMFLKVVEDIGNMEEVLFIDSVDFEWLFCVCLRGWYFLGVFFVILE